MTNPQEKAPSVILYHGLLRQNLIRRLNGTIELSMEESHRYVCQVVPRNLWRLGQCWINKRNGRPTTSEEDNDRVRQVFDHSSTKSIHLAARQLALPRSAVHKVLRKNLRLYAYKVQLLQTLEPNNKPRRQ